MSLPKPGPKNDDRIIPLAGPSHIHVYPGGYHMADNLSGGAKIYYDISPVGDVTGMRLRPGPASVKPISLK